MKSLLFASAASNDLNEILNYIAKDRPHTATKVIKSIRSKCQLLVDHPEIGQAYLLRAFNFNDEHMYQFDYRDSCGRAVTAGDPRLNDCEIFADEVRLGDLSLSEGDSMELWYDFGHDWRFTILLESIDESLTEDFKPKIIARKGKAPKQYDWPH